MRHIFINANLLDGTNPARKNAAIAVEGERIAAIATDGKPLAPHDDDLVYDLAGRTLMPGMVTGHYHTTYHNLGAVWGVPTVEKPPGYTAYRALSNVQSALRGGFTGLVGAGCAYDIDPSLAAAIEDGIVEGPRLVPCGPDTLSSVDGVMPWWLNMNVQSGVGNCDGPDELRKAVRRNVQRGCKMMKLTTSGGHGVLVGEHSRVFTKEEVHAAVEAAHDLGIRIRAHVAGKQYVMEAIQAGFDILDHCDYMDEECIEAMVETGVHVLPSLYQPLCLIEKPMFGFSTDETRRAFDAMCAILPKAAAAGVKLCIGDDFGTAVTPHGEYAKELAVYVEHAGISPLETIGWATRNGAGLLGMADELGTIEAGKRADLVIVDGDPSADIRLLSDPTKILGVMRDGRFFSGATLEPTGRGNAAGMAMRAAE